MDSEVSRLFYYLLTSGDLKNQSDRIIQESGIQSNPKTLSELLASKMKEVFNQSFENTELLFGKQEENFKEQSDRIIKEYNKNGDINALANVLVEKLTPVFQGLSDKIKSFADPETGTIKQLLNKVAAIGTTVDLIKEKIILPPIDKPKPGPIK